MLVGSLLGLKLGTETVDVVIKLRFEMLVLEMAWNSESELMAIRAMTAGFAPSLAACGFSLVARPSAMPRAFQGNQKTEPETAFF
jgi:hypothetical protein